MQVRSRTMLALATGVVLGFAASMTGNVFADLRGGDGQADTVLPWEDARLLAEVLQRVKRDYVDGVDDHALMDNAIRGMVGALDPHSAFLDAEEYEEIRASTAGSYPGVGIEIAAEAAGIKVLRPIEGSPAFRAGVRSGDLIVAIDGEKVGPDIDHAIERMRGPAGSHVTLTLARAGAPAPIDVALQRAQVAVHSVEHALLEPGYGYLRITSFSETTAGDVDRALADLERTCGGHLAGLVLDLRNNPGGVLEAAVEVSDAFLDSGLIVSAEGRTPDARFRMEASPGDETAGADLVVLVNGSSASAAEILAGALKDHHRAVLVGHTTYGKGSVQTVMPLSGGRAVKLTTSRYYTPSGASIQDKGITPDIVIDGKEAVPAAATAASDREVRIALDTLKSRRRLASAAH
ncbi:MAG TPA: S41 family peptidase [Steroidobacteraceae bacterium]|nr:S41 family peptidase [Steroidobacteraceae bacterium]HQX77617.1 S41 family peptidase [Steroidobacteraceae bacterium]HQZ80206.1 S41 family peptidase [Steroidobacteraceae bacterium]